MLQELAVPVFNPQPQARTFAVMVVFGGGPLTPVGTVQPGKALPTWCYARTAAHQDPALHSVQNPHPLGSPTQSDKHLHCCLWQASITTSTTS